MFEIFKSIKRFIPFTRKDEKDEISLSKAISKIDFDKFQNATLKHQQLSVRDKSKIQQEIDKHLLLMPDVKLVLSIDRLDYTKGIANRLRAFEYFLETIFAFKYASLRIKDS